MQTRCDNCGEMVSLNEQYCPTCGIPLKRRKAAQEPADDVSDSDLFLERNTYPEAPEKRLVTLPNVLLALLAIAILVAGVYAFLGNTNLCSGGKRMVLNRDTGYYQYNNTTFYNQDGRWYQYDSALGWVLADPSDDFLDNYTDYYEGVNRDSGNVRDFRESEYYDPNAGWSAVDDSNQGDGQNNYSIQDDDFGDGDW